MDNFQDKNQIIRIYAIVANITYILILIFWLLSGGLKFISKLVSVILSSPSILLNLHWDTQWTINKILFVCISLIVFSVLTFLMWKLNVKAFGEK